MRTFNNYSRSRLLLLTFSWLWICPMWSQVGEFTGLVFDSSRYVNFQLISTDNIKNEVLPKKKSLKPYAPFAGTQGHIPSCVGWAVGYGALSIYRAKELGQTDRHQITENLAHSASYIYNQIKINHECKRGAYLEDALDLLASQGNCLLKTFPNDTKRCDKLPNNTAKLEAAAYKVRTSGRIFELNASSTKKIRQVKRQLVRNNPVIVGMSISPSYSPLVGKAKWDIQHIKKEGHAMVVVGYDDNKRSFELMNSFGRSWGKDGFIDMNYQEFAKYVQQAFVLDRKYMTDRGGSDEQNLPYLAVESGSRIGIEHRSRAQASWQPVAVQHDPSEHTYGTKRSWKAGDDQFKFRWEIPAGRCAYLVTIGSRGKQRLSWSMDYLNADTTVVFPVRGAYQFDHEGEEQLLFLLSHRPIEDLGNKIKSLRFASGTAIEKLNKVLKEQLIPVRTVAFQSNEIQFKGSSTNPNETILAAVLSLFVKE